MAETRSQVRISDDDGCVRAILDLINAKIHNVGYMRVLLATLVKDSLEFHKKKGFAKSDIERFEFLFRSITKDYKNMKLNSSIHDAYMIANAKEKIKTMCMKNLPNESILEIKNKLVEANAENPYNKLEWKKFALIDEKFLNLVKSQIEYFKTDKGYMWKKELMTLGLDDVMKFKIRHQDTPDIIDVSNRKRKFSKGVEVK